MAAHGIVVPSGLSVNDEQTECQASLEMSPSLPH
jgi:hypothetical protein